MGHFHALAPAPVTGARFLAGCRVSVLEARSPPAVAVRVPFAFEPLSRRSSLPCRKVAVFAARRGTFFCRIKGSDLDLVKSDGSREQNQHVNGVFWILLLNLGLYVADHILQIRQIKELYLFHRRPAWYQFVTATFCHSNWDHLSSNLFFLYIFGKLVEEEEGIYALWLSYLLTGAGANFVSWLLLPRSAISMGASGSVFGLFVISVLVKMSWNWRKIMEFLILGQFVIDKVMEAALSSVSLTGTVGRGSLVAVNHIACISGALIGAALVLLISHIPSRCSGQDMKSLGGDKKDKT